VLTIAPATLTEIMLDFLIKCKIKSSIDKQITPAGREYNIIEILPENKLPITVITINDANAKGVPSKMADSKMKILESPSLAPGKIMGGKRLSRVKVISAIAERSEHNVIL
jgi:CxxC motif-containing protein